MNQHSQQNSLEKNRVQAFVDFIIGVNNDKHKKGVAAALRRADNPATEYQSWEQLAAFNIDLDKDQQRLPYATIAAAMTKAKVTHRGYLGIGKVIANCYDDGNQSDQAKQKLRRLLACDSVKEACRVLRPILSLINSKSENAGGLDFARLLDDLLKVHWEERRQHVKTRWAQDFYNRVDNKKDQSEEGEL